MTPPVVLTVAGTDSGGAAGLAADLATFAALGAHGACVVSAVTAQDTTGVRDVHPVPLRTVAAQLDAVLDDLPVAATKTGMLGTAEVVALVADRLDGTTLVVDPVLVATSGAVLGDAEVAAAYRETLLPRASVVTPNLDEAVALLGQVGDPAHLAGRLTDLCPGVVLTGGGTDGTCTDWVAVRGAEPVPLVHRAVPTTNDHGTGCTFSAALAVHLVRGADLHHAAGQAAAFTTGQLRLGRSWRLGRGRGPVAHTVPDPRPIHRGDT
ncbi:bifunctional hydroxymethylpyrimidine kinase/phosphomethylpyrimidine kinase [Nocardioides sp. SYSU D00065]|uniref:bifunctional hydroxymethylpyrimidine kinase/phosphomethylpyrimidine kinase n=1 Tax=Nocardioides sp. SYSU D00065 TaxID=2817378 RepID=UPI001B332E25|nr:bifunctional hydroxymethylpyrimidine kinase/phosphomethylpyrimidine kinase [Nocardioides sp. SYSU D00065]